MYLYIIIKTNDMTTAQLRNEIRETRNAKLNETKEMFEMGLLTPQERFSLDFKANATYKKEYSYTK